MPIRSNCRSSDRHQLVPLYSFCDDRYYHIKIGTNWCLFILTVMRDTVMLRSAPIGADLDLTISLRSTVRMNKEAPIRADSFSLMLIGNRRAIGGSLFILTVILRDIVILRSAPIGASSF